jgi:hypothetical protein
MNARVFKKMKNMAEKCLWHSSEALLFVSKIIFYSYCWRPSFDNIPPGPNGSPNLRRRESALGQQRLRVPQLNVLAVGHTRVVGLPLAAAAHAAARTLSGALHALADELRGTPANKEEKEEEKQN